MIVHAALGGSLCALTLVCGASSTSLHPAQEAEQVDVKDEAPVFMGWSYILEVDLAAGRRAGTLPSDVTDEEALERVGEALRFRLVGSGKFVEGQVAAEPGNRFAVTFVGKMGAAYDKLLIGGLSDSGRLVCYGEAHDDELPVREARGGVAGDRHQVVAEASNGDVGKRRVTTVPAHVEHHIVHQRRAARRAHLHRRGQAVLKGAARHVERGGRHVAKRVKGGQTGSGRRAEEEDVVDGEKDDRRPEIGEKPAARGHAQAPAV